MYQPNQRNNAQFKNFEIPTGNPQNISFNNTVRGMPSTYPNRFSYFPQQIVSPQPYALPMEAKMAYSNNYSNRNQPLYSNATATVVRPHENNGFPNHNNNVPSNFYNKQLYVTNYLSENKPSAPKNTPGFGTSISMPRIGPSIQYVPSTVLIRQSDDNLQTKAGASLVAEKNYGKDAHKTATSLNETITAIAKRNENEKIRIFTGTAEKIIKWHKIYNDHFCFYEIVASIVTIQEGTMRLQKIMLLRDKKGPIIQIIHYVRDHINIENFFVGQMLRCVGRMVGPSIMHGLSIREATPDEVVTLQRMCYISDHAISKALTKV